MSTRPRQPPRASIPTPSHGSERLPFSPLRLNGDLMAATTSIGLQLTNTDNVATVFVDAEAGRVDEGDTVVVKDAGER